MKSIVNIIFLSIFLALLVSCSPNSELSPEVNSNNPALASTAAPDSTVTTEAQFSYAGLSFDDYLEVTYRDLKLRCPEQFIDLGLDAVYDVVPLELNDVSISYDEETYQLYEGVLDGLFSYKYENLSPEQQLSYQLYEYWLEDYIAGYDYRYMIYIETGWELTSTSFATEFYFTESQVIENLADAQHYLLRLEKVNEKIQQLQETLDYRRKQGYVIPGIQFPRLLDRIGWIAGMKPEDTGYYTAFEQKLNVLDAISEQEKTALLDSAQEIISNEILPAYQSYLAFLEELSTESLSSEGVWQYDDSGGYYQYLLEHHTSTLLSADEIHQLGLKELERIHAEMREVFDSLGYSKYLPLENLYAKVIEDDGVLIDEAIMQEYERLISTAEQELQDTFFIFPQAALVVKDDPVGGYYLQASLDGSRPGAFYARSSGQFPRYIMPTLAYHEAIPGHHMQITLAQEMDLPTFRRVEISNGFTEGWALYAERLAYDLGWYQDDPYGNLGRLQYEAMRAARLVIDTGIHAMGWGFNKAVDFFVTNTGFSRDYAQAQVYRFIAYPGQATAYMVGELEILELRNMYQQKMGGDFDLSMFHQVVLENGSIPLDFLKLIIEVTVIESQAPTDS